MVKTIKIDENGSLIINGANLAITTQDGEADRQHLLGILNSETGHYRLHPLWGCNLHRQVNGPVNDRNSIVSKLRQEIQRTGFYQINNQDIAIVNGRIQILKFYRK